MGQTRQNVLRHQMFLIGRGFLRILHRAWGPQISHNTEQCDPSSIVQESRDISLITDDDTRLLPTRRNFDQKPQCTSRPTLTSRDGSPGRIIAPANMRKIQYRFVASDDPVGLPRPPVVVRVADPARPLHRNHRHRNHRAPPRQHRGAPRNPPPPCVPAPQRPRTRKRLASQSLSPDLTSANGDSGARAPFPGNQSDSSPGVTSLPAAAANTIAEQPS